MGCHLGWYFAEGCPLRGGRGVFIKKTPKTIKEKKILQNGAYKTYTIIL
jgi:hypothetical protein